MERIKRNKLLFTVSVSLNLVFILILIIFIYRYKELLYQKWIKWNGKAEIVMFGDSHTAGGSWNSLIETGPVLRLGWGGFSSDHLTQMIPQCIEYKPKYVFILCGGNDIVGGTCYSIDHIIGNFRFMADTLKSHHIKPVFQKLLYVHDNKQYNTIIDSINLRLADFCKAEHIDMIDIGAEMYDNTGLKAELSRDFSHLNQNGYKIWGKVINSYLKEKKN